MLHSVTLYSFRILTKPDIRIIKKFLNESQDFSRTETVIVIIIKRVLFSCILQALEKKRKH